MQDKLLGYSLSIISMVGLGISTFLYKRSTMAIGPVNTTFFYYLFSFFIAVVIWLIFREKHIDIIQNLHWPALIAASLFVSVLAFNFAVIYINVSIGSTIRSLSFSVTVILAIIFLKEQLSTKDIVALAFAIAAIVLIGTD